MAEDEKVCTKVTAHYSDGSTEDFNIFLLTGAVGLTVVGTDKGELLYMGEEGKFGVRIIGKVAATPDVLAALVKSVFSMLGDLLTSLPPFAGLQILQMLDDLKTKSTGYSRSRIKRINSKDN